MTIPALVPCPLSPVLPPLPHSILFSFYIDILYLCGIMQVCVSGNDKHKGCVYERVAEACGVL